jgi:hypothetical protein
MNKITIILLLTLSICGAKSETAHQTFFRYIGDKDTLIDSLDFIISFNALDKINIVYPNHGDVVMVGGCTYVMDTNYYTRKQIAKYVADSLQTQNKMRANIEKLYGSSDVFLSEINKIILFCKKLPIKQKFLVKYEERTDSLFVNPPEKE